MNSLLDVENDAQLLGRHDPSHLIQEIQTTLANVLSVAVHNLQHDSQQQALAHENISHQVRRRWPPVTAS